MIKLSDIQNQLNILNTNLGTPLKPVIRHESGTRYNPGAYCLDAAYGGYRLNRVCDNGSGMTDISDRMTKRELHSHLRTINEILRRID